MIVANTGTQSIIYNGFLCRQAAVHQSSGVAGGSACVVAISTTRVGTICIGAGTFVDTLH